MSRLRICARLPEARYPQDLPPGTLVLFVGACIPLAFLEVDEKELTDVEGRFGHDAVREFESVEFELTRGVDCVLLHAQRLSLSAVNGFAERLRDQRQSEFHPYPSYPRLQDRQIVWDSEARYVTPQCDVAVVNLSKQDPDPGTAMDETSPLAVATRFAAERMVVVVSVGNYGERRDLLDTRSALARLPWVVAVGATTDEAGRRLAPYSSTAPTGVPGPHVVAWEAALDGSGERGTSFAAPRATWQLVFLASWTHTLAHCAALHAGGHVPGIPLVGLGTVDVGRPGWTGKQLPIPAFPVAGVDAAALGKVLDALLAADLSPSLTPTPDRLKAMLARSARAIPGCLPHQVGFGFVSSETTQRYLERFDGRELASLFCGEDAAESLPAELATLPLAEREGIIAAMSIWQDGALEIYFEQEGGFVTFN